MPEGCPLLIPTGRDDRGGGGTVGGGTMEASGLGTQTVMIDKERWFPSHTPALLVGKVSKRAVEMRSKQLK